MYMEYPYGRVKILYCGCWVFTIQYNKLYFKRKDVLTLELSNIRSSYIKLQNNTKNNKILKLNYK